MTEAALNQVDSNQRVNFDEEIVKVCDYVHGTHEFSDLAYETAYYCLLDSIGCGLLSLTFDKTKKLLGPMNLQESAKEGIPIMGTPYRLDVESAAFNYGTMIRWLDYNDTWLAAEWGHPSDNLGAILAMSHYVSNFSEALDCKPYTIKDVLYHLILAHEIQGIYALENSFNRVGLDHVILVKLASTAVSCKLLGLSYEQTKHAIAQVWVDGNSLRTYRHAPNTGSRKSWAAGDATMRAVRLALLAQKGEESAHSALSVPTWGFNAVYRDDKAHTFPQSFGHYVMENILFKLGYPAEFHAQTAVECALKLSQKVAGRLDEIERVELQTQEPAVRIISKSGELNNPADRDHCLQYMVAIGLIYGELTAKHYEDDVAGNPNVDALRKKMVVVENKGFSKDYLDPNKRSIANSVQVFFQDGTATEKVEIHYPLGHLRRRAEGIPVLLDKFEENFRAGLPTAQANELINLCRDKERLLAMPIQDFLGGFQTQN